MNEVEEHIGPLMVCGGLGSTLIASLDGRWPAPVHQLSEDVEDLVVAVVVVVVVVVLVQVVGTSNNNNR